MPAVRRSNQARLLTIIIALPFVTAFAQNECGQLITIQTVRDNVNVFHQTECLDPTTGLISFPKISAITIQAVPAHTYLGNNTSVVANSNFVQPACGDLSNGAPSCSTDTTNANNISSGILGTARGGAGTITGALRGNGAGLVSQAACADLSNSKPSCSTDTTNASNITSGTLGTAEGGAGTINGALKGNGAGVVSQAACADLSNGATSCSTDTTNAANISSGTLPAARLPNPSATTLGGIESLAAVGSKWINTISTLGVPSATQPAASDLSNGTTGSGTVCLSTSPSLTTPTVSTPSVTSETVATIKVNTGVTNSGTGFQHIRVTSCTTPASTFGACTATLNWNSTWADTNYTATCTMDQTGAAGALQVFSISSKSTTQIALVVQNSNGNSSASAGTINCIGVHD